MARNQKLLDVSFIKGSFLIGAAFFYSYSLQAASSWGKSPSSWRQQETASPNQYNTPSNYQYYDQRLSRQRDIAPFAPGSHNLSIDVGQVFLMGDLGESYSDNLGFRMHYTYSASDLFAFDTSAGYSSHNQSPKSLSMVSLLAGLRLNLAWYDRVIPFAVFGLGFYRPSYSFEDGTSVASTLFGVHLGPGVNLLLTDKVFFGSTLTFHDIFSSVKTTANRTLEMGGTYTSFLLHAGMTF